MWWEKSLLLRAIQRDRTLTASVLMFLGVILASCLAIGYATAQDALLNPTSYVTREAHDAVVRSFENQISVLKWIGIAIITSLVGAIGLLYRSLEKSNNNSRNDLIEGIKRREKILEASQKTIQSSNDALHALSDNIERLLKKN